MVNLAPALRKGYAEAAQLYLDAGWLPIPVRGKSHPPKGSTGHNGSVTSEKVSDWIQTYPGANLATVAPPGVIGLDVDNYGEKRGADQIRSLEAEIGMLPPTHFSTSRESDDSAIRWYRVPPSIAWKSNPAEAVEIVQHTHRYGVSWPSIHPTTGAEYFWYSPEGEALHEAVPFVSELAELPAAWISHLRRDAPASGVSGEPLGAAEFTRLTDALDRGDIATDLATDLAQHDPARSYDEARNTLYSLAYWIVVKPETPGLATALQNVLDAAMRGFNARHPGEDQNSRLIALGDALSRGIAKKRQQYSAEPMTDEQLAWTASRMPMPRHRTERERLDDLTAEQAEAEFGWNWENRLPQAQMRAEAREARPTQSASASSPTSSSSWAPRDLSDVMAGDYIAPKPTVFRRTDGMGMFYPGVVNEFHAVGGTGKTLAALAVCDEALRDGQTVLYVDYEEHPARIVQRLRGYGISDEAIQSRFMYVKPTEKPTQAGLEALVDLSPSVVIIDTFAESFNNMTGGDSHRTDDVTAWFSLPRLFADAGACVIVTDHIPKDAQSKLMPIGSQAKHSGYKGAIYFLEAPTGAGLLKGEHGRLRFILAKDNGGEMGVRTGECAATFYLDATGEVSMWELQAPDTGAELAEAAATLSADRERIADALPVPSRTQLWEALGVNKNSTDGLRAALTGMIEDGSVIEEKVGNALTLRLASNKAPTPEADAEAAVWEGFAPRHDHVPTSPVPVPEDKEDIESDIHRIQLDVHRDEFAAPRSPYAGISDAELADILGDAHPSST